MLYGLKCSRKGNELGIINNVNADSYNGAEHRLYTDGLLRKGIDWQTIEGWKRDESKIFHCVAHTMECRDSEFQFCQCRNKPKGK